MTTTSPNPPLLAVRQLHKAFGDNTVLDGVNLDIHKGEVMVILGPSGSGKTTLLRCLNALETPECGELIFPADSLTVDFSEKKLKSKIQALRQKSGMVFQSYNLFPHKTAIENVMEGPLIVQKRDAEAVRKEAKQLLERVGLEDKVDLYPYQLSGGQQQRVGIARALAIQPTLMLFDEPTSALDPELVQGMLELMKSLAREGWTMVVVTHEIQFAREVADHVVLMEGGHIVEQGTPKQLFEDSEHPRTRAFLRAIGEH